MGLSFRTIASCVIAASLATASCSSGKGGPRPADSGLPDAGTGPIVGGKLGAAIASAAAASSASAAAKQKTSDDQPPENGIFPTGEADKRVPKDAPPKVDVISDGEGPKVTLAGKLDGVDQKSTLTVGVRVGQQRTPTLEFVLSIKADKPKDAPKDAKDAKDAPAAGASIPMIATATDVRLPSTQGLTKEDAERIGKVKGTTIKYNLAPSGAVSDFAVEVPKGVGEGLEPVMEALTDSISAMTVVLPPKPVGMGAYWIVADRAKAAGGIVIGGIEVVRYRVFKVQKIEGDTVTLGLDLRQYAVDAAVKVDTGGQKADVTLEGFDSQGKGTVVWRPTGALAQSGDMNDRVTLAIAAPGAPPGRGPRLQMELTAAIGVPAPDKK